ncbi:MAG TPA: class I SAM-dependent methyltransferase [Stellaceae bacterium]|nr:class I SAM-dependent methyltransferase [Stellaceae bacterium]
MRGESAGYIGDIPGHYDRGMGPVLFADYADDLARRVAARSPRRVLEIAAGTGILTQRLRDLLPGAARLVATDLNPPMLDTAKPKFAADEAIEFQQADALSLPFGDGAFDVVVCQFGVMFFPDKPASYKEVHRVLAPGGSYVFNVWDAHRHNPAYHIAQELVTAQFPSDPPGFFEVPFAYHAIDPVKDALGDAGFTDLRIAVLSLIKEVADIGPFTRAVVYGSPMIDQIGARGGDPDVIVAALDVAFRKEFGSAPSRIPLQASVFEATRL